METFLAVLFAALACFCVVWRATIRIRVIYRRKKGDDLLSVDVHLARGFLAYHVEMPVVKIVYRNGLPWLESEQRVGGQEVEPHPERERRFAEETVDVFLHQPEKWRQISREFRFFARAYRKLARELQRRMVCEKFHWHTRLGVDDPAVTCQAAGIFWLLKYQVYIFLKRRVRRTARPIFQITPVFAAGVFDVELECIFSLRLGNVINATASLFNFRGRG